jgi:hypothetical protein
VYIRPKFSGSNAMKVLGILICSCSFIPTDDKPVELPKDVFEISSSTIQMPLNIPADVKQKLKTGRLFVSTNKGKSWTHEKDFDSEDKEVFFDAPDDGLYWFAVQFLYKDGEEAPPKVAGLTVSMKVYVNTEGRTIKRLKTYSELLKENDEMLQTIETLKKRIAELEASQKSK